MGGTGLEILEVVARKLDHLEELREPVRAAAARHPEDPDLAQVRDQIERGETRA